PPTQRRCLGGVGGGTCPVWPVPPGRVHRRPGGSGCCDVQHVQHLRALWLRQPVPCVLRRGVQRRHRGGLCGACGVPLPGRRARTCAGVHQCVGSQPQPPIPHHSTDMCGAEGVGERILPRRRGTRSVPGWRIVRPCRCNVGVHTIGLVDGVGVEEGFAEQADVTEVTVCDEHIVAVFSSPIQCTGRYGVVDVPVCKRRVGGFVPVVPPLKVLDACGDPVGINLVKHLVGFLSLQEHHSHIPLHCLGHRMCGVPG